MKKLITAVLFIISIQLGFAQAPPIEWEGYYEPDWSNVPFAETGDYMGQTANQVWPTSDGGYIIGSTLVRESAFIETSYIDFIEHALIKLDAQGNVKWRTILETRNIPINFLNQFNAYINSVEQTPDEGFFIRHILMDTADHFLNPFNYSDSIRLLKLDKSGNIQWEMREPYLSALSSLDTTSQVNDTVKTTLYHHFKKDSNIILLLPTP